MRLTSYSVERYRSIKKRRKMSLQPFTRLIGPNNAGKSSLLRALALGVKVLKNKDHIRFLEMQAGLEHSRLGPGYDWEEDFPISLQTCCPRGATTITLEFTLEEDEADTWQKEVGYTLPGTFEVTVRIDQENRSVISGSERTDRRESAAIQYLRSRIEPIWVPASRPATLCESLVERLIGPQLKDLPKHQWHEVRRRLEDELNDTTKEMLPDRTRLARIALQENYSPYGTNVDGPACRLVFEDENGVSDLRNKGDGFKSLATLALLTAASSSHSNSSFLFAIEEPEMHLHPQWVHEMRSRLATIAEKHQVIATTHAPAMVDRVREASNIVITREHVYNAASVYHARKALGVHLSDNLMSAYMVVLVEGKVDKKILTAILRHESPDLYKLLDKNKIVIIPIGGADSLINQALFHKSTLSNVHALLDHDCSGRKGMEKAVQAKYILESEVHFTEVAGMKNSEIEDLINPKVYREALEKRYEIKLSDELLNRRNRKWTERIRGAFCRTGVQWPGDTEVKTLLADEVCSFERSPLWGARGQPIKKMVSELKKRLASTTPTSG